MNQSVHVHDDYGQRVFHAGDFPLEIGGDSADVRLQGVDGKLLAQVGLHGDTPFLAPAGEPVRVNGTLKNDACWLSDGDVIAFGDGHVVIQQQGSQIVLHARSRVAKETPPPAANDEDPGHEKIEPVAFHPDRGRAITSQRGARLLQVAVLAMFGFLTIATWFMFTARSVNILIEPDPQVVSLEGALVTPRVGGRYLMRPGAYRVNAELDGYVPLTADIDVGSSSSQQFVLQMEKLPGRVSFSSGDLAGATVLVDGREIGQTPLSDAEIVAGLHRVVIRARNYLPYEQEFEVQGMGEQQSLAVTLQPNWAPVSINSEPAGAVVSVDGIDLGVTPLTTEIEAGDREIIFSLAGYKPESRPVSVSAGVELSVPTVTMAKADGVLVVETNPEGANVSIDGQFRGRSPLRVPVRPDKNLRVSLTKPGYESASRRIELAPEQTKRLSLSLTPVIGSIRVVASPADAQLWVDGNHQGVANQVVELTARPHTIEIRKDGYATHSETLTPQRGLEQRITVVLETVAEAAVADLPQTITTVAGQLRLIRGGSFRMGSGRREQGRRSNEVLRDIELTREFYIGATEVSNAAFRQFLSTHSSGFIGGISLDDDDQPVVRISWQQAARFCNWLSDRDGLPNAYVERDGRLVATRPMNTGYRLPSEAEWTWVARYAGGARAHKFVWGDEWPPPKDTDNFGDHAVGNLIPQRLSDYDDTYTVSAPVGRFRPNALGLTELAGNVSEWTHDYYELSSVDPYLSLIDPLGPEFGDQHVIRGASWMTGIIADLRGAYRDHGAQGRPDLGFRLARYAR